ncbi:major facilitator superfamily domain-containing protein [Phaeosphaeria sp. MPI-PUGE-AT-0046c]|nr:major facilitator superfamily domain-containing protein [Phaeosphaeria sp. MPI-PUGE-AT-0046c]
MPNMFKAFDAKSSSPPRGLKWRSSTLFITIVVGMGVFTDLFLYGIIVPVMPYILTNRIGLPTAQIQGSISNLLAAYAAASVAASPVAGIVADKMPYGRKLPFVLGLVMLALATVLLAIGETLAVLVLARVLQGASGGVVWTIGLAIVIETVGQENLGKTMGTIFSFVSVAGLFAPICGGALYSKTGYKGVFGVSIGLIAIDLILRLLMVEKKVAAMYTGAESQEAATDNAEESDEQTQLLPQNENAKRQYQLPKPSNRITRSLPIVLVLRDPALVTAIWIAFMQAFLLGSFDATVPLVASEQFDFGSLKAGLLFLPLGGADFLLGPLFGWGVDRYDPSVHDELGNGGTVALYAGILALNGIGLSIINSPSIVEAGYIVERYSEANPEIFDEAPYAQLYGINSMVFSGGLTMGPLLAGNLKEKIGYGNMNAVIGAICGVTAVMAFFFMGQKEKDRPGQSDQSDIED